MTDMKKELIGMFNKGYSEGFADCLSCQVKAIEITIQAGRTDVMTLPQIITMLKGVKVPGS